MSVSSAQLSTKARARASLLDRMRYGLNTCFPLADRHVGPIYNIEGHISKGKQDK